MGNIEFRLEGHTVEFTNISRINEIHSEANSSKLLFDGVSFTVLEVQHPRLGNIKTVGSVVGPNLVLTPTKN